MKRGEVWWVDLGTPGSRRPVLLLSRDNAYAARSLILISPVGTRTRQLPSELLLGIDDGMPRECCVNLENLTTVPKDCLSERLTTLNPKKLEEIDAALRFALGME